MLLKLSSSFEKWFKYITILSILSLREHSPKFVSKPKLRKHDDSIMGYYIKLDSS